MIKGPAMFFLMGGTNQPAKLEIEWANSYIATLLFWCGGGGSTSGTVNYIQHRHILQR